MPSARTRSRVEGSQPKGKRIGGTSTGRGTGKGTGTGSDPLQDKLRKLAARISSFEERKGANFYKKAKFANAFKWKLKESGYDAGFADELVKELLIYFR